MNGIDAMNGITGRPRDLFIESWQAAVKRAGEGCKTPVGVDVEKGGPDFPSLLYTKLKV